jgi:hypothetical protein
MTRSQLQGQSKTMSRKRTISFILLAIICLCGCSQEKKQEVAVEKSKKLFRIVQNHKWGFIDSSGNIVIGPQFDGAMDFKEGYAAVMVGHKWGFIDANGEEMGSNLYP